MKVIKILVICICVIIISTYAFAGGCGSIINFGGTYSPPISDIGVPIPTTLPDEGYIDPVVNHKHAIGMDYVKYRMSGQSNWHGGIVTVNQGTNQNLHVRVKTKEKEGWEWTNIDVDLYYSENRWFNLDKVIPNLIPIKNPKILHNIIIGRTLMKIDK